VQGYLASVWVVAALLGPIVGGLIVRHWSWPWVFWVGIPIGLIAAGGFMVRLRESGTAERQSVDALGAVLFTVAVALLLVALTEAGADATRAWQALAAFAVASVALVLQERAARHPILSLSLWRRPAIAYTNAVAVLVSMALIGLTTFLPIYVQGVLHRSPVIAGLTLTMMTLGWPIGTTTGARSFHRFSLRQLLIAGCTLVPAGAIPLVFLTPASWATLPALSAFVMGLGMGLISISSLVLIQEFVEARDRGSATASTVFSRNLGSTIGATALGAVFNGALTRANDGVAVDSEQLRHLLEQQAGTTGIAHALQSASHLTFWCVLLLSVATLILGFRVPHVEMRPRAAPLPVE
jgi:MFS family permease